MSPRFYLFISLEELFIILGANILEYRSSVLKLVVTNDYIYNSFNDLERLAFYFLARLIVE